MKYDRVFPGIFVSRPNRFIANITIDGIAKVCHVKNTGRCRELLVPGARVYVQRSANPQRKTEYDLIAVHKGDSIINIDSQAPNRLFEEWLEDKGFFGSEVKWKREVTYSKSRFDFYLESPEARAFVEVKGVTLEKDGVVSFPDAPTDRGVKHLNELMRSVDDGYSAYVFFIIQMEACTYFEPNRERHPEFARVLNAARDYGVGVYALNCRVTEDSIYPLGFVEVRI